MLLSEILNSLDKSWDRNDILLKIKKGLSNDEIVDNFISINATNIKELNSLLTTEDIELLNRIEQLSTCESKLINKIKYLNYLENNENDQITNVKNISPSNKLPSNKISSFMIKWSNKFVVIALLAISAIALSKQAWA